MSSKARRVLVVDDNEGAARLLCKILARMGGHEVVSAGDGLSALTLFEEIQPDIVLLDIGLPGIDGYEVARRIRALETGKRVLLVALTGYGEEEDRQKALLAGFDEHRLKPASVDSLSELLADPRLDSP